MCDDSRVAAKEAAGAPETAIEITPKMIAAGKAAYFTFDVEDNSEDIVASVYTAMANASSSASLRASPRATSPSRAEHIRGHR